MSKSVLIVAAHADDEALGCGGTIARHVAEGDKVNAVFLADGVSSRPSSGPQELSHRRLSSENARLILGIQQNIYLEFPDNRLDTLPLIGIVQQLEVIIQKLRPHIIYTHHHGDLNVDHQVVHKATLTACRPMPLLCVRKIYAFEVMSSTEWATPGAAPFVPNHFVDIGVHLETKMNALKAYEKEMRQTPHSRSSMHLECLARHRGHSVGVAAAEAFMTVRTID
jgi:N-acetylglucosamine malate deacetylase 1